MVQLGQYQACCWKSCCYVVFSYQAFRLLSCQIMSILFQGRLQYSLSLLKMLLLDEEVILGEMYVIQ